jgi:peptidoglycan hydrolase-like protein with peptidoglycan-binding domain
MPAEAGMSEANRRQIQEALSGLGYYKGPVDGIFGRGTRTAIRHFQRDNKAAATGHLTADEANRLVTTRWTEFPAHQIVKTGSGPKAARTPANGWTRRYQDRHYGTLSRDQQQARPALPRHLAEFEYRFNRRYDLAAIRHTLQSSAVNMRARELQAEYFVDELPLIADDGLVVVSAQNDQAPACSSRARMRYQTRLKPLSGLHLSMAAWIRVNPAMTDNLARDLPRLTRPSWPSFDQMQTAVR